MASLRDLPRQLDNPRPAHLVLSDGTVFAGFAAGLSASVEGEVVFNTAMTGYQEMLTDPSYHGQILCLTTSHVGQVGVNALDAESDRVWARALVVQDLDSEPSSWRSEEGVEGWLGRLGVSVGWGFDVRSIVRHIRTAGAVPGVLACDGTPPDALVARARAARGTDGCDLAREVACGEAYAWNRGPWISPSGRQRDAAGDDRPPVAVIDYGVKRSILRRLVAEGLRVRVLPPSVSADVVLADGHAGVVLSNGPGDPAAVAGARELIGRLIGRVPVLGICLGCQLLGLTLGGRTVKLPFGHHGGNHPVRELATSRVLVTSQNHNYAVEESSLPREVEVTHINLTDGTLEGLALPRAGVEAVQFHPEAAPGPNDAAGLFARFARRCRGESA
ncbi:MAG: glutamine-hydrolyzing carbamoyl-phosphate synthase small subunit [Thermoanaerobaculales bacterium]|jgi:carbamoyl-phosphate synthase small subunit|nr:glutamine-hydrolyzing carbamoyl-phosphate synthase small subunit [Thermoanaerobaculales bacterium]